MAAKAMCRCRASPRFIHHLKHENYWVIAATNDRKSVGRRSEQATKIGRWLIDCQQGSLPIPHFLPAILRNWRRPGSPGIKCDPTFYNKIPESTALTRKPITKRTRGAIPRCLPASWTACSPVGWATSSPTLCSPTPTCGAHSGCRPRSSSPLPLWAIWPVSYKHMAARRTSTPATSVSVSFYALKTEWEAAGTFWTWEFGKLPFSGLTVLWVTV